MTETSNNQERIGYTVSEFSALFGRGKDWGYKRIYAGDVKILPDLGEMLISQTEVNRIKKSERLYVPKGKKAKLAAKAKQKKESVSAK